MSNKRMKKAIALGKQLEQTKQSKLEKCVACNGTGRYDNTGSPKCGACNGTGFEEPTSTGQS